MEIKTKKIGKWNAMVTFDKENELYTVSYDGSMGAIVSRADLASAESRFIEMMNLGESVRKLLFFKENGAFNKN
jgi:hypothetical protein